MHYFATGALVFIAALTLFPVEWLEYYFPDLKSAIVPLRDSIDQAAGSGASFTTVIIAHGVVLMIYVLKFTNWAHDDLKPVGFPPRPTRQFTTWVQYWMWASLYAGSGVLLVYLFYSTPSEMIRFIKAFGLEAQLGEVLLVDGLVNFSLEALIMGVAIAVGFLGFPGIEPRWRMMLQRAALIPSRATNAVERFKGDFKGFQPSKEDVDAFVTHFRGVNDAPELFQADFTHNDQDEGYLEIYPRMEFTLWKLRSLRRHGWTSDGIQQFAADLKRIEGDVAKVRVQILNVTRTVTTVYGERLAQQLNELHEAKGFPGQERPADSVILLDNILSSLSSEWLGAPLDPRDKVIIETLEKNLHAIRDRCDEIMGQLLQIVVLVSLRSMHPDRTLRNIGFGGDLGRQARVGWDLIPWMILSIVISSVIVALIIGMAVEAFKPDAENNDMRVVVYNTAMLFSAILGGYLIATLITWQRGFEVNRPLNSGQWTSNTVLCFAGATASVVLVVALVRLMGPGLSTDGAIYYIHIPGLFGAYVANAFLRGMTGQSPFRSYDVFLLPIAAIVFTLLARMAAMGDVRDPMLAGELPITLALCAATAINALAIMAPIYLLPLFLGKSGDLQAQRESLALVQPASSASRTHEEVNYQNAA